MVLTHTVTHILTFKLNTSKIDHLTSCPSVHVDIVCFWIFIFYKVV